MTIRRPALLIAYGPEARAFFHSGLHESFIEAGMTPVIFASQPLPEAIASPRAGVPWPGAAEPAVLHRLRALSRRAQGRGAAGLAERLAASYGGGTTAWKRALSDARVDAVICASQDSARTLPALQTAANAGLPTVVFENSWKDVHRRAYAPAAPTAMGFTTQSSLEAYARVNGRPREFEVCGSLHVSALARAGCIERSDFCRRLGLDPARPIVCYSTARTGVVEEELGWVQRLWRRFQQIGFVRPQLLVRTNPMDEFDAFGGLGQYSDSALLKPRWEWNPSSDWCCPLQEDALMWASAIRHSAVNVSVASMVTLEFAAFGRPVINPVFAARAKELFDSSFYGEARQNGWAQPAASLSELEDLILQRLAEPARPIEMAPRLDAATRALDLVRRVGALGKTRAAATSLSSVRT